MSNNNNWLVQEIQNANQKGYKVEFQERLDVICPDYVVGFVIAQTPNGTIDLTARSRITRSDYNNRPWIAPYYKISVCLASEIRKFLPNVEHNYYGGYPQCDTWRT